MNWPDDIRPLHNGWDLIRGVLYDPDSDDYAPDSELTVTQVAQMRGSHQNNIRRHISDSKLPAVKRASRVSATNYSYVIKAADAVRASEPRRVPIVDDTEKARLSQIAIERRAKDPTRRTF